MNITHEQGTVYESDYKNPLKRPSAHSLQDCLTELKFGRTVKDQKILDNFITQLNTEKNDI